VAKTAAEDARKLLLKPLQEQVRAAHRATGFKPSRTTPAAARATLFNRPQFSSVTGVYLRRTATGAARLGGRWRAFMLHGSCAPARAMSIRAPSRCGQSTHVSIRWIVLPPAQLALLGADTVCFGEGRGWNAVTASSAVQQAPQGLMQRALRGVAGVLDGLRPKSRTGDSTAGGPLP
jgi:hypothetical protein